MPISWNVSALDGHGEQQLCFRDIKQRRCYYAKGGAAELEAQTAAAILLAELTVRTAEGDFL